jgi:hypothetical protein
MPANGVDATRGGGCMRRLTWGASGGCSFELPSPSPNRELHNKKGSKSRVSDKGSRRARMQERGWHAVRKGVAQPRGGMARATGLRAAPGEAAAKGMDRKTSNSIRATGLGPMKLQKRTGSPGRHSAVCQLRPRQRRCLARPPRRPAGAPQVARYLTWELQDEGGGEKGFAAFS